MFQAVIALFVVSGLIVTGLFIWERYWHPVCPECKHNLNSQRMAFGERIAWCRGHKGSFLVGANGYSSE